jgi:hypothetical protein
MKLLVPRAQRLGIKLAVQAMSAKQQLGEDRRNNGIMPVVHLLRHAARVVVTPALPVWLSLLL